MISFHTESPHYNVKWIPKTVGARDDNMPGPWPDQSRNQRRQRSTPWLIETDDEM